MVALLVLVALVLQIVIVVLRVVAALFAAGDRGLPAAPRPGLVSAVSR